MSNKYKKLFEGKFKVTRQNPKGLLETFYYNFSASNYPARVIYKFVSKAFSKSNKRKIKILDVGCGGGHEKLNVFGKVYGVDISEESLKNASKIYFEIKKGDIAKKIPYPTNYFDIVYCVEVFGHIDRKDKEGFLGEIARVLKNNGYVIMSAETEGNNWLVNLLKKKKVYKKFWIDVQGHIGMLTPGKTVEILGNYFDIVRITKTSTWVLSFDGYLIFLENHKFFSVFRKDFVRRIINILIYPAYRLSLVFSHFDGANNIVLLMKKSEISR